MFVYKAVSPDFIFCFSSLNYVVKLPDWPVPGYHGNCLKNQGNSFVRIDIIHLPPKYGLHTIFRFIVTSVPVFSQSEG